MVLKPKPITRWTGALCEVVCPGDTGGGVYCSGSGTCTRQGWFMDVSFSICVHGGKGDDLCIFAPDFKTRMPLEHDDGVHKDELDNADSKVGDGCHSSLSTRLVLPLFMDLTMGVRVRRHVHVRRGHVGGGVRELVPRRSVESLRGKRGVRAEGDVHLQIGMGGVEVYRGCRRDWGRQGRVPRRFLDGTHNHLA